MTQNINDLSLAELQALALKQQEQLEQKDRQIAHLTRNARKWVQKFDDHQSKVAENVIKKFELEFERERNELHAKLTKMSKLNSDLVVRYRNLERSVAGTGFKRKSDTTDLPEPLKEIEADQKVEGIEINVLAEPASITEIEFSNEMQELLAKYVS